MKELVKFLRGNYSGEGVVVALFSKKNDRNGLLPFFKKHLFDSLLSYIFFVTKNKEILLKLLNVRATRRVTKCNKTKMQRNFKGVCYNLLQNVTENGHKINKGIKICYILLHLKILILNRITLVTNVTSFTYPLHRSVLRNWNFVHIDQNQLIGLKSWLQQ